MNIICDNRHNKLYLEYSSLHCDNSRNGNTSNTDFQPTPEIGPCNEDQFDALFILSLFRQSTSTCFGHICSPSSGGILYIHNWYILCFLVECLLAGRPTDSQLKSTTHTHCCRYTEYLLMMGYKYARNM